MNIRICTSQGVQIADFPMPEGKGFAALTISRELLAAAGSKITLRFDLPILDIQGYWAPNMFYPEMRLPWTLDFYSAANRCMPFVVWNNLGGVNRGAFALTCINEDAHFNSQMSQAGHCLEMTWTVAISKETESFDFLANFDEIHFAEIITAYRKKVAPENPSFPDAAWQPVYCTWYAAHAAYTIDFLEKNAALAKEYGFGTFILDDGWSYDTVKRLTPATCPEWFSEIGSWQISEKKLPNFAEHVKRVQAMGLNYVIWFSPYLIGQKHEKYNDLKQRGSIIFDSDDGSSAYDPADIEMRDYTCSRFIDTFRKYGFDGVKIDFIDFVRPNVDNPHGIAAYNYVRQLVEKVRETRPDALIEFRQFYATPAMLPFATNFRANDVPFDFMANFHRCALVRATLGDGIPVHSDPIWFHPEESSVNVARHFMAALMGVPMISLDLDKISLCHAAIIKRFMSFYHEHLDTFRTGHWSIRYRMGMIASVTVETNEEKITFLLTDKINLAHGKNNIILNLSPDAIPFDGNAIDADGNQIAGFIPEGGMGIRN